MDNAELRRYDRQILLPELGLDGQKRLKDASVLIIGAGGLGCPILLYLAGAGLGTIGVIDHDVVEENNLQRQILYNILDLGKNKAKTATEKASLLNPNLTITSYPFKLEPDNARAIIEKYDIIVDGSDNFPTKYLVNDTCVLLNKTLVFGSLFQFEGQVSVFNHNGGPDYRSLYPEQPAEGEVPNCGESGVIGTLPGIVGSYMANEVIKLAAGFGVHLSGKLLTIDALSNQTRIFDLNGLAPSKQDDVFNAQPQYREKPPVFNTISISELKQWQNNQENFVLIDVREPYEFEEGNIGGLNIPIYELPYRIDEIPSTDKLVFYCTSNYRSRIAVKLIQSKRKELLFLINF
jgi:molybdopterin/thiamine biosynthesis adenylyltransferase